VNLPASRGTEGKAFIPNNRDTKAVAIAFLSFDCSVTILHS
jgi:hypothetical protein